MRYTLIFLALLLLALPLAAQEATPEPAPEATAEPEPVYAWCGYLLLENVIVGEDELALLATLFPADDGTARPRALMQWRPSADGTAGLLDGCHLLPVERWRVVSLLQQASGAEYSYLDGALVLTQYETADEVLAMIEAQPERWEP